MAQTTHQAYEDRWLVELHPLRGALRDSPIHSAGRTGPDHAVCVQWQGVGMTAWALGIGADLFIVTTTDLHTGARLCVTTNDQHALLARVSSYAPEPESSPWQSLAERPTVELADGREVPGW